MVKERICIYSLSHPVTGCVRYVGKTLQHLCRRLSDHEYKARSGRTTTPIGRWIRKLLKRNMHPKINELEIVEDGFDWKAAERKWIKKFRDDGCILLNRCDGGNGAHTRSSLDPKFVEMLGVISDARIAEMAGLSRENITYHRHRAGIPRSNDLSRIRGFPKGNIPHNVIELPLSVIEILGTKPDIDIAKESGISRSVITQRRNKAGIPVFKTNRVPTGAKHHKSKLSAFKAKQIRDHYIPFSRTSGIGALSKKYKVHTTTIYSIIKGETWK